MVVPFGSALERRSRTSYRPTVTLEGSTHVDTSTGTTSLVLLPGLGKLAVVAVVRQQVFARLRDRMPPSHSPKGQGRVVKGFGPVWRTWRIAAAPEQEEKTRQEFASADTACANAAQRRQVMQDALTALQHGSSAPGSPHGLTQLAQAAASVREKALSKRGAGESLRQVAGLADLAAAEAALAQSATLLDQATMQDRFQTARRLLRKAIEEVLAGKAKTESEQAAGDARPLPALGPPGGASGETQHAAQRAGNGLSGAKSGGPISASDLPDW